MINRKLYQAFATHTKFCIVGGGTGGLNLSAHLLTARVNPKDVRIFEASQTHYYQPGWTMLGAQLCKPSLTCKKTSEVLPRQINLTKENVASVDPDQKLIKTQSGESFTYDHLVFASGLKYHWQKIKGAQQALQDPNSKVSTIYRQQYALKFAKIAKQFKGGNAVFTEAEDPIKCGGAPQKILYLWTDKWRKNKIQANIEFLKPSGAMFKVPKYSAALSKIAKSYNIKCTLQHKLIQINGNTAIFENLTDKSKVQRKFDLLHIVPPMGAHSHIKQSGLANQKGFLDVDKFTLRHKKYPNVWGIGDCLGTPNSKTAAAAFEQTQTLVKNILASQRNKDQPLPSKYVGYSSCPIFVGREKLMLAEFKYDEVVEETFFNDQEKPRRIFYYLKKHGFPFAYWNLVPRGIWNGRKGIRLSYK